MFTYDGANRLTRKDKGNTDFETYGYDAASHLTNTGYFWADGTLARSLSYGRDPVGNVLSRNEGNRVITYGYDGLNQQTSESETGFLNYTYGYTYDHNGNRLTQTQNGSLVQSFTYDAHDKLTSGTSGNEVPGYDANGNETSLSIFGGNNTLTWDDEDRLTAMTTAAGARDTFVYNGLGLRVGKTDSTGTYSYVCNGTSAGSPVLSDGHALYTAGLSENRVGTISYYENDQLGNLWTLDNGSGDGYSAGYLYSGFGALLYGTGSSATPFKYGGGNGCQTDVDTGLVLMGHRYYDSRIGRFISQDPAGSGNNWYAYAGNDPVDETDPTGLFDGFDGAPPVPHEGDPAGQFNEFVGQTDSGAADLQRMDVAEEISRANITGPAGYADQIRLLLSGIALSPIGESLLLQAYFTKQLNIEYFHDPLNPNSAYVSATDTIYFDPAFHVRVNSTEGLSDSPPIGILEHELGHDVTGLADPSFDQTIYDTQPYDNISANENPFRAYLGLPARKDHDASALPNGGYFDPAP